MFEYLAGRTPKYIDEDNYRQYAVMVALTEQNGELSVVFEKRSGDLKRQPGEICLPGGSREGNESAMENAVRETMEELRVSGEQIHVIAQMDTLLTAYDNNISVFLCELEDYRMTGAPEEVAEIFTVPLNFFLTHEPEIYTNRVLTLPPEKFPYDKIPGGRHYPWREGRRNVYFYYYEDRVIWGMTAYIMHGVVKTIRREGAHSEETGK